MPSPAVLAVLRGRPDYFPGASFGADFTRGRYKLGGRRARNPASLPGWTFTRASTGYAETAAGALTSFASGAPRITDKGMLVEEARTNLCLQSQALATSPWISVSLGTGSAVVATNNYGLAPDGTMTATRLQCNLGGGTTTTDQSYQVQPLTGTSCWGSFYIKTNDGTSKNIYMRCANATVVTVTGTWTRYDFNAGSPAGTNFGVGLRGGQSTACSDTCDILVWGAQLEAGAFATSYIPTTTASATRAADIGYVPYTPTFPITMVGRAVPNVNDVNGSCLAQIYDGTNNNRVAIDAVGGGTVSANTLVVVSTGVEANISRTPVTVGTAFKMASRLATNDVAESLNGGTVASDTLATMPSGCTRLGFGHMSGFVFMHGYIQQVIIYPYAMNDAQLRAASA